MDGRFTAARAVEIAGLVARLGLTGIWIRQPPLSSAPAASPGVQLTQLRTAAGSAAVGLIVQTDLLGPAVLDALTIDDRNGRRAGVVRLALSGSPAGLAPWRQVLAGLPTALPGQIAMPPADGSQLAPADSGPPALAHTGGPPWPTPAGPRPPTRRAAATPCSCRCGEAVTLMPPSALRQRGRRPPGAGRGLGVCGQDHRGGECPGGRG